MSSPSEDPNERRTEPETVPLPETPARTEPTLEAAPPATKLVAVGGGIAWRLIFFLLLALVLVVFAVQNTGSVDLSFLGWSWNVPLAVVLVGVVVATVILDEIFGFWWRRRRAALSVARQEEKTRHP